MRLAVIGASSGTGWWVVQFALTRGHDVVAFSRRPYKPPEGLRLHIIQGDARDLTQVERAVVGVDAVLSCVGPSGLGKTNVCEVSVHNMITAMRHQGVRRLIVESTALLQDNGFIPDKILRPFIFNNVCADARKMEAEVRSSGLHWTLVRPPRLTHGPFTGDYQAQEGKLPRGRWQISRADVADFMLRQLEDPTFVGKAPSVVG